MAHFVALPKEKSPFCFQKCAVESGDCVRPLPCVPFSRFPMNLYVRNQAG